MMAVQAQYVAHASRSSSSAAYAIRPALENAAPSSGASALFLDEAVSAALLQQQLVVAAAAVGGGGNNNNTAVFSDLRSELTCSQRRFDDFGGGFVPRKRARVGGEGEAAAGLLMSSSVMEGGGHRALLPPPPPQVTPQAFGDVHKSSSRVVGSGAASTSGRPVCGGGLLLSHLYRQSVEVDALVRFEVRATDRAFIYRHGRWSSVSFCLLSSLEWAFDSICTYLQNERLRAGLEEARRRHLRAVVSAVDRAAARRLHAAEAELERALGRNAELDERLRQMGAEGQAWLGIAKSHEAAAAGLRATLDQLLPAPLPPRARAMPRMHTWGEAERGEGGSRAELRAHTIGRAQCANFRDRIYNDTDIDASFAASLRAGCPQSGDGSGLAPLDESSPDAFDNGYFGGLLSQRGLLHSDQALFAGGGGSTDGLVRSYASSNDQFASDFSTAMVKMGNISPLTGSAGEIRVNCRAVN
uniref:Plant heme peroxidase family profile domain-containing protein n=1 Tax=Oryza rufipogon TaxID=4529 RepID=A0A0E0NFP5_ORYRU